MCCFGQIFANICSSCWISLPQTVHRTYCEQFSLDLIRSEETFLMDNADCVFCGVASATNVNPCFSTALRWKHFKDWSQKPVWIKPQRRRIMRCKRENIYFWFPHCYYCAERRKRNSNLCCLVQDDYSSKIFAYRICLARTEPLYSVKPHLRVPSEEVATTKFWWGSFVAGMWYDLSLTEVQAVLCKP